MKRSLPSFAVLSFVLAACGQGDIEVAGTWQDTFGSPALTITNTMWGDQTVVSYANDTRTAVTQNPDSEAYGPGSAKKFNKVAWTEPKDGVWYTCTFGFGLGTQESAENNPVKPFVSETEKNCGSFTWTKMAAKK